MSVQDENEITTLYRQLLDGWNQRDAKAVAALFREDGHLIGFDGSQMHGSAEIATMLGQIFTDHQTATYVSKIRAVQLLSADVAILRAVVGMIPPGQADINPAVNALQTVVATKSAGQWRIVLFQNTPAQFHGRPELTQQLSEELRAVLRGK